MLLREGYISSVLIVCPTSLKYQWKREIKSLVGAEALVIEGSQPVWKELYDRQDASLFDVVAVVCKFKMQVRCVLNLHCLNA